MARNEAVAKAQREYVYLKGRKAAQRRKELIEKRRIEDYFLGRSAYQEGEEKGKAEEKEMIAKKLLTKKMSVKEISDITNLSKEEVEKLKN